MAGLVPLKLIPLNPFNYTAACQLLRHLFPDDLEEARTMLRRSLRPRWARFRKDTNSTYRCFLIRKDNSFGSFVGLTGLFVPAAPRDQINLGWLGIEKAWQQKGFGRRVLDMTMALARQEGYANLRWHGIKRDSLESIIAPLCRGLDVTIQETGERKRGWPLVLYSFDLK